MGLEFSQRVHLEQLDVILAAMLSCLSFRTHLFFFLRHACLAAHMTSSSPVMNKGRVL
ncbi:hypothetical protein NC652_027007 [Populus alba x Populus x berolinensis]|nr:hypothetical protein NC652_027007 [Populus alba x Populus x berolinensis]